MTNGVAARPVLVLGAGIHGVAIARELVANGLAVVLVDRGDLASGATAKSSRLIHGGLRYLEYGDVGLVRESLAERRANLELAPHFVKPLRLFIPVKESWSGLVASAVGFCGGRRSDWLKPWLPAGRSRGFWPLRLGLSMYDWLAADAGLPASEVVALDSTGAPRVAPGRYTGMLAYSDAQMRHPERVVFSLLLDARRLAAERQTALTMIPYGRLVREGDGWRIVGPAWTTSVVVRPSLIINASGAAGDETLRELGLAGPMLFGGTRGSHLITAQPQLCAALRGQAVYAEAHDGRPVFTLPFGDQVLIGTTDETHHGPVDEASASPGEVDYLRQMVRHVFGIALEPADITAHYSGVRPLPRTDAAQNAAISREHSLVWRELERIPVVTLVGGKLTTWRSFAAEVVDRVLPRLGGTRIASLAQRRLPGNDPDGLASPDFASWAREAETTIEEVTALWDLCGTECGRLLAAVRHEPREMIPATPWSARLVRRLILEEDVTRLEDLVERRLLTVFSPQLSRRQLVGLAGCLIETGRLDPNDEEAAIEQTVARLERFYGRRGLSESRG